MQTHKTETINARIEPSVKRDAERILSKLGLTNAEAIRLFYKQICLQKGLPFEVKIPNEETLKAIHNVEKTETHKDKDLEDLFS